MKGTKHSLVAKCRQGLFLSVIKLGSRAILPAFVVAFSLVTLSGCGSPGSVQKSAPGMSLREQEAVARTTAEQHRNEVMSVLRGWKLQKTSYGDFLRETGAIEITNS